MSPLAFSRACVGGAGHSSPSPHAQGSTPSNMMPGQRCSGRSGHRACSRTAEATRGRDRRSHSTSTRGSRHLRLQQEPQASYVHLCWETLTHHAHFKDVKGEAQRAYVICLVSNLHGAKSSGSQAYQTPRPKLLTPSSTAAHSFLSSHLSLVKFTYTILKWFPFCGSHSKRIIAQVCIGSLLERRTWDKDFGTGIYLERNLRKQVRSQGEQGGGGVGVGRKPVSEGTVIGTTVSIRGPRLLEPPEQKAVLPEGWSQGY